MVKSPKREVHSSNSTSGGIKKKAKIATGLNDDGTLTLEMAKKGQRYPEESPGSGDYVFYQTFEQFLYFYSEFVKVRHSHSSAEISRSREGSASRTTPEVSWIRKWAK